MRREVAEINVLIENSDFNRALENTYNILGSLNRDENLELVYVVACFLVDLGQLCPDNKASKDGLDLMYEYEADFIGLVPESDFQYNLANAELALIDCENPFDLTFSNIEVLVAVKNRYWKAIKLVEKTSETRLDYLVNQANVLKRQFRVAEALGIYDQVNGSGAKIQSWTNRSDALIMLNNISGSHSIKMLTEVVTGYKYAADSPECPPQWISHYHEKIEYFRDEINQICENEGIALNEHDNHETDLEYEALSEYWKFCLTNRLTLSEHAVYCPCAGSREDNLTILTSSGVSGEFVIPMERVLNRLKSEFALARHLYFEYQNTAQENKQIENICFSELFNEELLGLTIEKARTSFRLCFGILDKIGVAVCELYDVYPPGKNVYFQNFWRLDLDDRRDIFESVKCPGLLALYSIATDLNDNKDGELSFYKDWRNALEHDFLVVLKHDVSSDLYDSFGFTKPPIFTEDAMFKRQLERLLQLTRSAVFSFVFSARSHAKNTKTKGASTGSISIDRTT